MARDDAVDKEFDQIEKEIEAKVDSLFVEVEEGDEGGLTAEEDPWKGLKEHFLTLEWEIDRPILEKIVQEVQRLKARFPEGSINALLSWMGQVTERIEAQGTDLGQGSVNVLHEIKDGLMRLVEDPFQDPDPILIPLRGRVEKILLEEEEAPTVTLDAMGRDEELLFEDLDRTVEEVLRDKGEPILMEGEPAYGASDLTAEEVSADEAVEIDALWDTGQKEEIARVEEGPGWQVAPEVVAPAPAARVEEAPPELVEGEPEAIYGIKAGLAAAGMELQQLMERFQGEDPLGLGKVLQEVNREVQVFSTALRGVAGQLQGQIRALQALDLTPKAPEPIPPVEPEEVCQDIIFFSVSNRVFGVPLTAVRGVFRVSSKAVPHVVQMNEVSLRGETVPLISMWKKLGLGRALYAFPKEEKRVLLVQSRTGPVGLLVDQVLARQEVTFKPVEGEDHPFFKGIVTVEKNAFVVDIEAL